MDNIFPQVRNVIQDLAGENIQSSFVIKIFCKLFDILGLTKFCEANRENFISLAENGKNPYDTDVVSKNFKGIYPELSFSVILEDFKEKDPIACAAKLIYSSIQYRDKIDNENNNRDKNLFGGIVNLSKIGNVWKKEVLRFYDSDFIIVVINGNYYKLIIQAGKKSLTLEELYSNLSSIVEDSKTYLIGNNYGILTANQTEQGAEIFRKLQDLGVNEIDKALFILTLDTNYKAESLSDFGRHLHIGSYKNKDYRKSMQFLVTGDARSGVTFNLFSGVEGVSAANFSAWISNYSKSLKISSPDLNDKIYFKRIKFTKFEELSKEINVWELEQKIEKKIYNKDSIFRIDSIGKDKIKKLQVSPDAFFHVALHLFYYSKLKKVPYVFNFANLNTLKYPCITRYLSTTSQLINFLKLQSKEKLLLAMEEHKVKIAKIKAGNYPFHYFYYYLFRPIKSLKPILALILSKLFISNFIKKYLSPDIWASNIPGVEGIECLGRFGTKLGFLKENAIAGHYIMFDNHIKICFLANNEESIVLDNMKSELELALLKVYDILLDNKPL